MTKKRSSLSSFTRREIVKALTFTGQSPSDVSRIFGVSFEEIHDLRGEGLGDLPDIGPLADYPHIVAIRQRAAGGWNLDFNTMAELKIRHDQGVINLTYYHGKDLQVMYAFPRAVRAIRNPWFTGS